MALPQKLSEVLGYIEDAALIVGEDAGQIIPGGNLVVAAAEKIRKNWTTRGYGSPYLSARKK